MKIAETRAEGRQIPVKDKAVMRVGEEKVVYSWDLTHDYNLEDFPDEIDRCL